MKKWVSRILAIAAISTFAWMIVGGTSSGSAFKEFARKLLRTSLARYDLTSGAATDGHSPLSEAPDSDPSGARNGQADAIHVESERAQERPGMLSADRPEAATPPGSLEHISPEGEELLRMYEAIAAAFEAQPSSCSELAAGTEELIRANHAALTRWAEVQEELGSVGQGELEAAGRPRFQRVRDAFRAVLIRCASDQGLQAAMRKLAEAGMSG